jgi:transposase, IS5 family
MKQQTLAVAADQGFEQFRRPTRRDVFLQTMNEIVPWVELCAVIEPHYPKGEGGRPPIGLERMVRMLFVQHWFNLADAACEEALYDSASLRRFVGIDLGRERVDISGYSQPSLDAIARKLNERPRKTLGYRTPAEMFNECVASTG